MAQLLFAGRAHQTSSAEAEGLDQGLKAATSMNTLVLLSSELAGEEQQQAMPAE